MSKIKLTPGSKKFKLLAWMADRNVTTYGEIQRFLCEMNGKNYNQMETIGTGKAIYENGRYVGWKKTGDRQVRVNRGIWATNLSSGRDPILHNYCERMFVDGNLQGWVVKVSVKEAIKEKLSPKKSSLEKTFPSDEIQNNSKVVSVKHVNIPIGEKPTRKIVLGDFHMSSMPDEMKDALDKLTICPAQEGWKPGDNGYAPGLNTREALLDAARLAPKVSPLVALKEKFDALKKERNELYVKQDAIAKRLTDIENEMMSVRGEVFNVFDTE